jgi:hypothetical protein
VNSNPTVAAHSSTSAVIAIYTGTSCVTVPSAQRIASAEQPIPGSRSPFAPIAAVGLAGVFLFGMRRHSRSWKSLVSVLLFGVLGLILGCGGSSKKTTVPPVSLTGTYKLTVTGTDSVTTSNTTSTTFTLTVK